MKTIFSPQPRQVCLSVPTVNSLTNLRYLGYCNHVRAQTFDKGLEHLSQTRIVLTAVLETHLSMARTG